MALVQAKRLAWNETHRDTFEAVTNRGTYEANKYGCWRFRAINSQWDGDWIKAGSDLQSSMQGADEDNQSEWREATEVVPLEWEKCERPNGSYFLRCNKGKVRYRVGEDVDGVYASIDNGDGSGVTDLRHATEADAIAACDAHNRAAVIGN